MTKVHNERKPRASCLDLTRVLQDEVVVHSGLLPSQAKITENRGARPKRFNFVSKTREAGLKTRAPSKAVSLSR